MKYFKLLPIICLLMLGLMTACEDDEVDTEVVSADEEIIQDDFEKFDEDDDDYLSDNEFSMAINEHQPYNAFYTNADDKNVNDETFSNKLYYEGDINEDKQIDENEFNTYYSLWLVTDIDTTPPVFGEVDKNKNNVIDNAEFMEIWSNRNVFKQIDKDGNGVIDENEYFTSMYGIWDLNNNGRIEKDEFQKYEEWSETYSLN